MTHRIWNLSIQKIRLQIYIHIYIHTSNRHDVRYNTVNFRLYLDWQHSDCNVTVEFILAMVCNIIFKIVFEYKETTIQVQEYQTLLILIQCCHDEIFTS
jgi:hypothetical protein